MSSPYLPQPPHSPGSYLAPPRPARAGVSPQPPRPRRRSWVLTALAGLLIGAILVSTVWLANSQSLPRRSDSAGADAAAACGILDRLPDAAPRADEFTLAYSYRVEAAGQLAAAAAEEDPRYRRLADLTKTASQAVTTFALPAVDEQVRAARLECDR